MIITSRHVPHSSAPPCAETGRARDRRSRFARLRLGGPRRRLARQRPTGVPLRSQDGAASLELILQQRSLLLVNAGLSCVDESDLGSGRRRERRMSFRTRTTRGLMRMRKRMLRSSRSFGCSRGKQRVRSLLKP